MVKQLVREIRNVVIGVILLLVVAGVVGALN